MPKIYIIDDQYVKDNFPSLSNYSNKDIIAVIDIEQRTSLMSTISYSLYNELLLKIKNNEVNGEWVQFLKLCQEFLLYSSVKSVYDFYEKSKDGTNRDFNVSNLQGKISFAVRNLKKFIEASGFTTSEEYQSEHHTGSPIFYSR